MLYINPKKIHKIEVIAEMILVGAGYFYCQILAAWNLNLG